MDEKLKQLLQDYVTANNSGKFKTSDEVLEQFPDLKPYGKKVLDDYVATTNSGKYKNIDEINAKFPEFSAEENKIYGAYNLDDVQVVGQRVVNSFGLNIPEANLPFGSDLQNLLTASEKKEIQKKAKQTKNIKFPDDPKFPVNLKINPFETDETKRILQNQLQLQRLYNENPTQVTLRIQAENAIKDKEYWDNVDAISLGESLKASANNTWVNLQKTVPQLQLASVDIWEKTLGKELTKSWYELEGRNPAVVRAEAYAELASLDAEMQQTKGTISDNIKYLNGAGLVANLADAMGSLVSTAVPAVVTGGAATFTSMTGQAISDYNTEKAKSMGITVEQLYKQGDNELRTPLLIGSMGATLELIGLKGIQNVVSNKIKGVSAKKLALYALDMNREGLTEITQGGLDKVNRTLATGGTVEDATKSFYDHVTSKEGLNEYLMGMLATGGVVGANSIITTIKGNEARQDATTNVTEAQELNNDLNNENVSEEAKAVIQRTLKSKVNEIATAVEQSQEQTENLSVEDKQTLSKLEKNKADLETVVLDENVSDVAKKSIQPKIDEINDKIDELKPTSQENTTTEETNNQPQIGDKVGYNLNQQDYVGTLKEIKANGEYVVTKPDGTDYTTNALQTLEQVTPEITEDPEIIGEVEEAAPSKLEQIRTRREEIRKRLSNKLRGTANSGFNIDAVGDLVELGVTYIQEGVLKFSEFAQRMREEYGQEIPDENMREIFALAAEEEGKGIRGFGERVRTDENMSEEVQQTIDETETLYDRQQYSEVKQRLSTMDEADKQRLVGSLENVTSQLSSEQNIGVLAGIELINEYNAAGRAEDAAKIIESLSKSATVAAQTLRQYGEFKNSTPDGYVQLVEKWMGKAGKKLTPQQKQNIIDLYNAQQQLSSTVDANQETLLNDLAKENYKNYYESQVALEDGVRNLEDYIDNIRGKKLFDTLAKILQGNLLTLKSVVINPFANMVQFGIRSAENDAATAVDKVVSLFTKRTTKSATLNKDNVLMSGKAALRGIGKANRKAFRGAASQELSLYDSGGRLKPLVAWKRLYENIRSKATREENGYTVQNGLSDFAEGTLGVPANIMFRTLPYGDDPFFEQAKTQRLLEIGKNDKNLTGQELEKFIINPDEKSLKEATEYGRGSTFQDENFVSKNINRLIGDGAKRIEAMAGENAASAYRFIMKGILPFVNTPSSIALKTVKFAIPLIPFSQAMNDIVKLTKAHKMTDGKLKESAIRNAQKNLSEHMGEAIVSATVLAAATFIVASGLATGDLPDDEFQKKQKGFMYSTQPPNTINISGLKRVLSGGDVAFKQGDEVKSYIPLGLIGAQIGIISATKGKELREANKKAKIKNTKGEMFYDTKTSPYNPLNLVSGFMANAPASIQYFFNQSFVQGTSAVLEAATGSANNLLPQLTRTYTTIGIPNTVSQAFRASNDYMRDLYTDDSVDTFVNIIKEKYGDVEDLPIKYDMWGQPIKQTPQGQNPYVYQMLDIFRSQEILNDKITYQIFDIQRKTGDDGVIPSSIEDSFTKKDFKVKLNKQEKSELTRMVGEERLRLAKIVLKSYNQKTSNPESFVERLKKVYTKGSKIGRSRFKKKYNIK